MKKYFLILVLGFSLVLAGCVGQIKTLADILEVAGKNNNYYYRQVDLESNDEYTEIFFKDGKIKIKSPVGNTYIDVASNRLYAGSNEEIFQNIFLFSEIPAQLEGFLEYNLIIPIIGIDLNTEYIAREAIDGKTAYVFELSDNQDGYNYTTKIWFWDKNGLPIKFSIINNANGNSLDIKVEDMKLGTVTDQDVSVPAEAQLIDASQAIPEELINGGQ